MDVRLSVDANDAVSLMCLDYETYNLKYVLALAERFYAKGFHIYLDYR